MNTGGIDANGVQEAIQQSPTEQEPIPQQLAPSPQHLQQQPTPPAPIEQVNTGARDEQPAPLPPAPVGPPPVEEQPAPPPVAPEEEDEGGLRLCFVFTYLPSKCVSWVSSGQ